MALSVGTNSYVSRADATTYFASTLRSADWVAVVDATKDLALMTATRMLDRQTWSGEKYSGAQALEWPRSGVTDKYGEAVTESAVPQSIIDATCELALALTADATIETKKNTSSNIKSLKAGEAGLSYFRPVSGGRFPTIVQELVGQFLASGTAGGISAPMVTGNDGESQFDCNPYGLNGGLY